jgi:elongation factor P
MIPAGQIKVGMVLHEGPDFLKVVSFEFAGTAQSGRTVKLKLRSLTKGNLIDAAYKAEQMVKEADLTTTGAEFLYEDGENLVLMDENTFEQLYVSARSIGGAKQFLSPNMKLQVQLYEGRPIQVIFPETAELKVTQAPAGIHQTDSTGKEVELENGMKILAPQFIREGDTVIVNVETGRYVERVKKEK